MKAVRTQRLIIDAVLQHRLRTEAEAVYPNEFCALLIGRDAAPGSCRVSRIVTAANVHPEPRTAFELDPKVLIDVLRDLRESERAGRASGERLLGHMHSHPDGPATPSSQDASLAFDPGQIWMIASVMAGSVGVVAAFEAGAGDHGMTVFSPVAIEIDSDRPSETP